MSTNSITCFSFPRVEMLYMSLTSLVPSPSGIASPAFLVIALLSLSYCCCCCCSTYQHQTSTDFDYCFSLPSVHNAWWYQIILLGHRTILVTPCLKPFHTDDSLQLQPPWHKFQGIFVPAYCIKFLSQLLILMILTFFILLIILKLYPVLCWLCLFLKLPGPIFAHQNLSFISQIKLTFTSMFQPSSYYNTYNLLPVICVLLLLLLFLYVHCLNRSPQYL